MSMIEEVPEKYRTAEMEAEFLAWLRIQPLPNHTKKYILLEWCEFTGVKMTRGLAEAAGIPLQI